MRSTRTMSIRLTDKDRDELKDAATVADLSTNEFAVRCLRAGIDGIANTLDLRFKIGEAMAQLAKTALERRAAAAAMIHTPRVEKVLDESLQRILVAAEQGGTEVALLEREAVVAERVARGRVTAERARRSINRGLQIHAPNLWKEIERAIDQQVLQS